MRIGNYIVQVSNLTNPMNDVKKTGEYIIFNTQAKSHPTDFTFKIRYTIQSDHHVFEFIGSTITSNDAHFETFEGKKLTYKLCNSHHFSVSIKRYGVQVKEKSFTTPTSY